MFHRNHSRAALFGLLSSLCTMSVSISQEPKTVTPPKPVPAKAVEIAAEKGAEKKTKWIPLIESDSLKGHAIWKRRSAHRHYVRKEGFSQREL